MTKVVISDDVSKFFAEDSEAFEARYTAIKFRGKIYVANPRHMDCINLAFEGMTEQQKRRICWRISDGKETMLFGSAKGDGSEWEWDEKNQAVRLEMYHLN